MYTTIITLYKQGLTQRKISKTTGVHRSTVKKIITKYKTDKIEEPTVYKRKSKLDQWHSQITELFANNLSTVRIFEELQKQGFEASYASLSRYLRINNIKYKTCIRFHTPPGEEAQVDFGDIGKQLDKNGKLRKAYVFNMRLSYSRFDYYEVVFDQKISTWIRCHINAFNYFGAVPKVIKLDNLKAGVIDANYYEPIFQKEYKRLADHYGFLLSACRPCQPQEKGKVESGIKYVKGNFFMARKFSSHEEMNRELDYWSKRIGERIHGTTKNKPITLFTDIEFKALKALPELEFDTSTRHIRKVAKDCHITLHNNYYSVPAKYVAMDVEVLLSTNLVKILANSELVAVHARSSGTGVFTTNISHYDKYKSYCPGFAIYDNKVEKTIEEIGESCSKIFSSIKNDNIKGWHRSARGIINLRKFYSDKVIDQACKRALYYGINSYSKIKAIIESNSYNLPLDSLKDEVDYAEFA